MKTAVRRLIRAIRASEKGGTAIEYGLICALIVLAMMAALQAFATKANLMWANVANQVSKN